MTWLFTVSTREAKENKGELQKTKTKLEKLEETKTKLEKQNQQNQETQKQLEEIKKQIEELKQARANKVRVASATYSAPKPIEVPKYQPALENAKLFIYEHESGNRTDAINASSGACGLGQALPCSKMGCSLSDYACQDAWFTNYMKNRYGTWENAKSFWLSHKWW